jgi:hypothetical protein
VREWVDRAMAHPHIAVDFAEGDWYLIGSRAAAVVDDRSDWDTVVFSRHDPEDQLPTEVLEGGVSCRPAGSARPTRRGCPCPLASDTHTSEIELLGPTARRAEASRTCRVAFELRGEPSLDSSHGSVAEPSNGPCFSTWTVCVGAEVAVGVGADDAVGADRQRWPATVVKSDGLPLPAKTGTDPLCYCRSHPHTADPAQPGVRVCRGGAEARRPKHP